MDKCREAFEAYFKEHHADSFYSVDVALEMRGDDYIDFLASDLWAIWQHQQAKVEELQTHAQEIHKREIKLFEKTLILTHERDELQKRVDAALELCKKGGALSSCLAMRVEKALKGEGYD